MSSTTVITFPSIFFQCHILKYTRSQYQRCDNKYTNEKASTETRGKEKFDPNNLLLKSPMADVN